MAASWWSALRVVAGCQRHLLVCGTSCTSSASQNALRLHPILIRNYAAAGAKKNRKQEKDMEEEEEKKKKEEAEEKKKKQEQQKQKISDTSRHKPFGLTAWAPVDNVYVVKHYPKPVYDADVAIDMLKSFQKLDFTPEDQPVDMDLKLDMKLEKKKKVETFVSTILLPHPFKKEVNRVVFFTENPEQARLATENGAAVVGGAELVDKILEDEITADFFLAAPDIIIKLLPLKNKLRKKFPKRKRGSVGEDIAKMMQLFLTGHEYMVERESYIVTQVATLDMPKEHIIENMRAILQDVSSYKPAEFGPLIERVITCSRTSEALCLNINTLIPQEEKEL